MLFIYEGALKVRWETPRGKQIRYLKGCGAKSLWRLNHLMLARNIGRKPRIVICEGEPDALALTQALGTYDTIALALPDAGYVMPVTRPRNG